MTSPLPFFHYAYPAAIRFTLVSRILFAILLSGLLLWAQQYEQPIPSVPLHLAILTLALGNSLLGWIYLKHPATRHLLEAGLCIDVFVLTEILYFSGGAANPIVSLYLPPILIAALVCRPLFAWGLTLFAATAYIFLFYYHLPFPIHLSLASNLLQIHIFGMWLTFVLSAVLITACITRLIAALNHSNLQLYNAHIRQQQNEQLLSIGIEAAHLAHKLSTPLNSLLLLNQDWQSRQDLPSDFQDDINLMHRQLEQCRTALKQLKHPHSTPSGSPTISFYQTLADHLAQWHNLRPEAVCRWQQHTPAQPDIHTQLDPLFWPAFLNILNNAADAGSHEIWLETRISGSQLQLGIRNSSGFLSNEQLDTAGLNAQTSSKPAGMGMGVLLSHATFSRMGGSLSLHNHPEGGVYAEICVPLASHNTSES